jgi:hypothetical protein
MSNAAQHVRLAGSAPRSRRVQHRDILDEDFRADVAYELRPLGRIPAGGSTRRLAGGAIVRLVGRIW